jgi:site-specific recombinase XerD
MDVNNTFTISFYLRNDKIDSRGRTPIYMRITVNGKRADISTHRKIEPNRWNKAGKAKGNKDDIKQLNSYLDILRNKIYDIRADLIQRDELVSAEIIKNEYNGQGKKGKTLIEVFEYHNQKLKELVGKDYAPATHKRYETTLQHVKGFLKYKYRTNDIYLTQLDHEFVTELEYFFKIHHKCNHNTAAKYIKNLKKVVNLAVKNDWLAKDPFAKYNIHIKEVKRDYLEQEELSLIEEKDIRIERLDVIRDAFVLACYTGYAYAEIEDLAPEDIVKGIDGEYWIVKYRLKTDTRSSVPLLPQALRVIEKYKEHPLALTRNKVIPIPSNQKVNVYLKELATICGINKNLTFHMARHTFATTVTLTNGVPIESVSQMLGHKNIRTTQIYAKVVEKKVSEDMLILKNKLTNNLQRNEKKSNI